MPDEVLVAVAVLSADDVRGSETEGDPALDTDALAVHEADDDELEVAVADADALPVADAEAVTDGDAVVDSAAVALRVGDSVKPDDAVWNDEADAEAVPSAADAVGPSDGGNVPELEAEAVLEVVRVAFPEAVVTEVLEPVAVALPTPVADSEARDVKVGALVAPLEPVLDPDGLGTEKLALKVRLAVTVPMVELVPVADCDDVGVGLRVGVGLLVLDADPEVTLDAVLDPESVGKVDGGRVPDGVEDADREPDGENDADFVAGLLAVTV